MRRLAIALGLAALAAVVLTLLPAAPGLAPVTQSRPTAAQSRSEPALTVEDYEPRSTLVVDEHPVARARFPVVDVHSHHRPGFSVDRWHGIVSEMDALNLQVLVNLSGGWGSWLRRGLDTIAGSPHPDRMVFFANLDFRGGVGPGFGARAAAQLEQDVAAGAVGLKFFKDFGISVRDERGRRPPGAHPEPDPAS
ncbi:MAG: hypothetical protein OXF27_12215, partial [Acidobacteria bacterium]|nr:hypothetical protein [Acidobacteriota bacterium]